jgi:hypothetical protein
MNLLLNKELAIKEKGLNKIYICEYREEIE